jgi:hypothetical protein
VKRLAHHHADPAAASRGDPLGDRQTSARHFNQ